MSMYFTSESCAARVSSSSLRDPVRIRVEEPNPFSLRRLDLRQPRQQVCEAILETEIFAVSGGVLADQVDLANALREQPRWLRVTTDSNRRLRFAPRYCGMTQNEQGWSQPSEILI